MRFVAQKTGLSPHVIRVWERRYAVVAPNRSGSNRRLYTDDELERLNLLAQACRCGHNIGNIAQLPDERLRLLAADCLQAKSEGVQPGEFITTALAAVRPSMRRVWKRCSCAARLPSATKACCAAWSPRWSWRWERHGTREKSPQPRSIFPRQ